MTQIKCLRYVTKFKYIKDQLQSVLNMTILSNEIKNLLDATTYEELTADCTVNLKSKLLACK